MKCRLKIPTNLVKQRVAFIESWVVEVEMEFDILNLVWRWHRSKERDEMCEGSLPYDSSGLDPLGCTEVERLERMEIGDQRHEGLKLGICMNSHISVKLVWSLHNKPPRFRIPDSGRLTQYSISNVFIFSPSPNAPLGTKAVLG